MGIHMMPPLYKLVISPPPSYGPPVKVKIYPDKHPEVTSVDGYVERSISSLTGEYWGVLRVGAGTGGYPSNISSIVGFARARTTNKWYAIVRSILLFDISVIPVGSLIISATLNIRGKAKYDTGNFLPRIGVYESHPASDIDLVPADYNELEETLLSNEINYADWGVGNWNIFTLNTDGKALVIPGGITKLGLRESKYDVPNVPPTWTSTFTYTQLLGDSSDNGIAINKPYLEVTYQPLL